MSPDRPIRRKRAVMDIEPRTEKSAAFTLQVDRHEMMAIEAGLARIGFREDKVIWGEKEATDSGPPNSYYLWRQVREALGWS